MPARAGRHREAAVAKQHDDLVERDAEHFGGGLRDDRVAAGADVGHVGGDRHHALAVDPDARARLHVHVVAERRRHAKADQPVAVADLRRLRVAPVPAELRRAFLETADEVAVGELSLRLLGVDQRIVDDAETNRVHAQLLRHLVHRDLERHHARRFAGRAHRIGFGQVEHREMGLGQPVVAGVEQLRLVGRSFRAAAGQVARPRLVRDRGDLAGLIRADADALDRRRSVGGVVHQLRPGERNLDRPPRRLRRERRHDRVGAHPQFSAEPAADIRRDDADLLLGDQQRLAHVAHRPSDHLVAGPQRQFVAVPRRDGGVRLHHHVALVGRGIGGVELHRRAGEGAREVTARGLHLVALGDRRAVLDRLQLVLALGAGIIDADALGGVARLLERLGDDDRDRLIVMFDLRPGEHRRGMRLGLAELAGVLVGHDRQHAGRALRIGGVDPRNPPLGDACTDDHAIGMVRCDIVALERIGCGAGDLERTVDAIGRPADDLLLVDRVAAGGGVELHAARPSASTAASVRSTSGIL